MQLHSTATAIPFSPEGRILMLHHRKLGVWLFPGGHVEQGELPDEAALREIREETGVRAQFLPNGEDYTVEDGIASVLHNPWYLLREDIGGRGEHFHLDFVYLCHVPEGQTLIQSRESDGIGWFARGDIECLPTYENVRRIALRAMDAWEKGLFAPGITASTGK